MASGISDLIAGFINETLREADGTAELQRSDLPTGLIVYQAR